MLDMLEKELNSLNVFENNIPDIVKNIANAIPVTTIPYRMKLTFAVSELILFTSHFRRNIAHWNGSSIPINSITFCIAKSGASKDSSVKAARKCFKPSYLLMEETRKEEAKAIAINLAKESGEKDFDKWEVYKNYYKSPNPLFVAPSTTEGFIQHLNDLDEMGIGAGYIYSGEFGAELSSNATLTENIKLLSELYDEGTKEVKIIKDRNNQSKEIVGLPTSALFVGSQDNILLDESIKRKFKTEFTTKLARRSFFNYISEEIDQIEYTSIEDMLEAERKNERIALDYREKAIITIKEVYDNQITKVGKDIDITEEVVNLFLLYRRYNEELAKIIDSQYPITKLTRTHLQWKALKLSGAFAIIHNRDEITLEDYKAAIEFVELLNKDMFNFEKELSKEPYELFCDYANHNVVEGKCFISIHTLRKMGFLSTKGTPSLKMKELIQLATAFDPKGVYKYQEDGIMYEQLYKTEVVGVSFVECTGTKDQRRKACASGYEYAETDFEDLAGMLERDLAYTPFRFINGIRGKENLSGTCKWVVLDIDSSEITDEEAHILLSDINHHIARTSDPNNAFKFRVLLELDSQVDIPDNQWRWFIQSISEDLGLKADFLPKSQIYFSFKDRNILSTLNASTIEVKNHVFFASNKLSLEEKEEKITAAQQKVLLNDPLTTFDKAFNAKQGEGSRRMIGAARRARELGASKEYVLQLMRDINEYWIQPLSDKRFEETIINQINRWKF